jgi:uncharacterized protein YabN with tetrapyrrole methylase and pyrophosphatase domain
MFTRPAPTARRVTGRNGDQRLCAKSICAPDELGDLLFQVVYHARMAEEDGSFSFADVARRIADKMVRRHPHVFPRVEPRGTLGAPGGNALRDAAAQTAAWEDHKRGERLARAQTGCLAGVPCGLPALARAAKLTARASRVGFDWPDTPRSWRSSTRRSASCVPNWRKAIRRGWPTRWATCCSCWPIWRGSLIWTPRPVCGRPT